MSNNVKRNLFGSTSGPKELSKQTNKVERGGSALGKAVKKNLVSPGGFDRASTMRKRADSEYLSLYSKAKDQQQEKMGIKGKRASVDQSRDGLSAFGSQIKTRKILSNALQAPNSQPMKKHQQSTSNLEVLNVISEFESNKKCDPEGDPNK